MYGSSTASPMFLSRLYDKRQRVTDNTVGIGGHTGQRDGHYRLHHDRMHARHGQGKGNDRRRARHFSDIDHSSGVGHKPRCRH